MFNPIFRKLFWKELRTLWPFWAAVVVLCMLIDLNLFLTYEIRNFRIFLTATMLPALYGLGCAGTQFAWELESGTLRRLRALPISSGKVVWAKLTWTIVSSALLAVTLCGLSYLWTAGKSISGEAALRLLNIYSLATFEAIAWGAILSMRSRSPLLATVKAGTAAAIVFLILTTSYALITGMKLGDLELAWRLYQAVWPYRLGILVLLFGVVFHRGRNWFDYWRQRESQDENARQSNHARARSREYISGHNGFYALCQLYWRQNRKFWGLILLLIPVLIISLFLVPAFMPDHESNEIVAAGFLLSSLLVAVNIFGADQNDHGFEFFANHGITARKVWLSRALLSGLFFAMLWSIGTISLWTRYRTIIAPHPEHAYVFFWIALGPCLFACGLFCSALCRSLVLAWVGGLGLMLVCYGTTDLIAGLQANPFLILLPGFAFMIWSYWIVSKRLHACSSKRTWQKGSILLGCCLIVFVALTIWQRIESVPERSIHSDYLTDYEKAWKSPESAQLWEELEMLLTSKNNQNDRVQVDRPPEWLKIQTPETDEDNGEENDSTEPKRYFNDSMLILNDATLTKVLQIANAPKESDWSQMVGWNAGRVRQVAKEKINVEKNLTLLRYRLFDTAEYYSRTGQPEKSLDCLLAAIRLSPPHAKFDTASIVYDLLPRWSTGPGVTSELVQEAIHRVEKIKPPVQNLLRMVIARYLVCQKTLDDMDLVEKHDKTCHEIFTLMPWEHARAVRVTTYWVWDSLETISFEEDFMNSRVLYSNDSPYFNRIMVRDLELLDKTSRENYERTLLPQRYLEFLSYPYTIYETGWRWRTELWQTELYRRLALTSLAIRAFQLKHDGALPGSLEDVADQLEYPKLMSMPCGPPFSFRREGFTEKLAAQPTLQNNNFQIQRSAFIGNLAGIPCIVLDKKTLYDAYRFVWHINSNDDPDKRGKLTEQHFYSIPSVYPLPFESKRQEAKKGQE